MTDEKQNEIFNEWFQQYKALFFKVLRAYAAEPDDQDDLFQEIVIQVWRSIPKFRGESAVSTWLYRIALNTAIKWSGRERKHDHGHSSLDNVQHILKANSEVQDERLFWLYREISYLDEIDRSLALLMLDGYSYKEMADIAGITSSNIGVKIHRLKKHLIERSKKYNNHGV